MTDRYLYEYDSIEHLIRPENDLERKLVTLPEFRKGLQWGEPRFGHPEGKVALHVREVLDNIEILPNLLPENRDRLRLIAIAHDTFKHAESRTRPRDWTKRHGLLARRFMEGYTSDPAVLDVIETHDDAYYKWLIQRRRPSPHSQLDSLLSRVGHCLQLYYLFFKCDTQTGDKIQAPLRWFEQVAEGIDLVKIKPFWPWERI
ncbi:MAG: HD domain-containing protein [Saprospiraceae bacterium]